MALTPERIKELQRYSSGARTSAPSVPVRPKAKVDYGVLENEENDLGITRFAKNVAQGGINFATRAVAEVAKVPMGLTAATYKLAGDFASKKLGVDNPVSKYLTEGAKNIDFYKQGMFESGNVGATKDTASGKVGGLVGQIAPYFAGSGFASIPARILADTAIATGQSNNFGEGAKTGLVSSAIESIPVVGKGIKMLKGASNFVKPMTKTTIASNVAKNMAKGAGQGYVADVGTGLSGQRGEDKTGSNAFIPGIGTGVGTLLGTAKAVKPLKADFKQLHLQNTQKNMDKLIGSVTQGKIDDIAKAKNALTQLGSDEVKKVKTFQDYEKVLNDRISYIEDVSDKALEKSPVVKKLSDLSITSEVPTVNGPAKVSSNYVEQGLSQLDDYYTHTNDVAKSAQVKAYIQKANNQGLTAKDINEIAKLHSQDLSGFSPTTNQLSNGLAKQSAENTRKGIKDTSREMFGDKKLLQEKDKIVSDLINTINLANKMSEKVNKFEQSMQDLGFGSRLMNGVKNIVYGIKFMFIKTIAGLSPTATEKMNPAQLEKNLNQTLTDLTTVLKSGKSENEILKALNDIAKKTYTALPIREEIPGLNIKPDASGIDKKATAELTRKIDEQTRRNTPLLPSGTKGTVKSETIPLPAKTLKTNQDYTGRPLLKQSNQSGKISISGVKATNIHPDDVKVLKKVKAVKDIKDLTNAEYNMYEKLANRFGISMDLPLPKMKALIDKILAGKVKVKGTLLPGSLKSRGMTAVNPLTVGAGMATGGALLLKDKKDK